MSARAFIAVLAALAIVGLLGFGLLAKGEASVEVGSPAPDAELPTLDGEGTGRISDYRGDWVLVNFWASWCDPCRRESPALERYWRRHRGDGLVVLGIDSRDLSGDALDFVEEFGLTYPQLRDGDGERSEAFGMLGFPESFLVDPEGNLALIRRGPVDTAFLERYVTPLVEGTSTTGQGEGGSDG